MLHLPPLIAEIAWCALRTLRPLFGPPRACRYTISCSEYAAYLFRRFPLHTALWYTFRRLISCW